MGVSPTIFDDGLITQPKAYIYDVTTSDYDRTLHDYNAGSPTQMPISVNQICTTSKEKKSDIFDHQSADKQNDL